VRINGGNTVMQTFDTAPKYLHCKLQIATWLLLTAYRNLPTFYTMVPSLTHPLWCISTAYLVMISKSQVGCLMNGIESWWNWAITLAHATDTSASCSSRVNRWRDCHAT